VCVYGYYLRGGGGSGGMKNYKESGMCAGCNIKEKPAEGVGN
jgi:hypothetical protein